MTTLIQDSPRDYELGNRNDLPVIAADIIYEGSAMGRVKASGHVRPLTSVDIFEGFAKTKADNAAGAAAAINGLAQRSGAALLAIPGAVITDLGLPVYATDDNTFSFSPVGGVFVGFTRRWVESGYMIVEFDVAKFVDPWAGYVCEAIADNKTLDVQDTGKAFFVTVDAKTVTLPATAVAINCIIVNMGAFGTVAVNVSPDANDKIMGPDIAGGDNKDLINTKATACRGDFVDLRLGHADGAMVQRIKGTWTTEG